MCWACFCCISETRTGSPTFTSRSFLSFQNKYVSDYVLLSWSAMSFFSLNQVWQLWVWMLMIDQHLDPTAMAFNRWECKQKTKRKSQSSLPHSRWVGGVLACLASCNLPLNFNVPAPVIRHEKDDAFTQLLMGKWEQLKLFTLHRSIFFTIV